MARLSLKYISTRSTNMKSILTSIIFCLTIVVMYGQASPDSVNVVKAWSKKDFLSKPNLLQKEYNYLSYKPFKFNELAPFCKMEHFANKDAKFPVKFRLGSVDYVDQLESKSNF